MPHVCKENYPGKVSAWRQSEGVWRQRRWKRCLFGFFFRFFFFFLAQIHFIDSEQTENLGRERKWGILARPATTAGLWLLCGLSALTTELYSGPAMHSKREIFRKSSDHIKKVTIFGDMGRCFHFILFSYQSKVCFPCPATGWIFLTCKATTFVSMFNKINTRKVYVPSCRNFYSISEHFKFVNQHYYVAVQAVSWIKGRWDFKQELKACGFKEKKQTYQHKMYVPSVASGFTYRAYVMMLNVKKQQKTGLCRTNVKAFIFNIFTKAFLSLSCTWCSHSLMKTMKN